MNENMEQPESRYTVPTPEEMERLEDWLKNHPYDEIPMEMRRGCEAEVAQLEEKLTDFESKHSLDDLNAIVEVPGEDTEEYQKRIAARDDLIPIVALLTTLRDQTNISETEHDSLKTKYKVLSRAVGFINEDKDTKIRKIRHG